LRSRLLLVDTHQDLSTATIAGGALGFEAAVVTAKQQPLRIAGITLR
jgi:hypothetical protein